MKKIILASASPRRQQLLQQAEIDFEIVVSNCDENFPISMPITDVPNFIAKQKAIAVAAMLSDKNCTIIAADTIVVIDNKIIGKPENEQHAIEILRLLSNKKHQVITGVCILKNNEFYELYDTTDVYFNTITEAQILHYVQQYKPYDKAGAYAIQEWIGVIGIQKIDGCFYNVMGLPVSKILPIIQ
jgi:septum formation protein